MRAQEIGGDQRRDHARDEQAHQHRDDHGEAERLEELPRNAGHQRDGQEHGDDRHGRRKHGEADLVGGVERRLVGGFAHSHVPDDILDLDDRVVDQHTRDQAHRQQRQPVQRDSHQVHEEEGRDRRQRDRQRGNDGGADVAEEQENDEDGEDRAFDQAFHRRGVLGLGIVDLVEDFGEADLGVLLLDLVQLLPRLVVGRDLGRAFGPLDLEADDLLAVLLGERALLRIAVLDLAEVGEPDEPAAGKRDLGLAERVGIAGVAEHAHRLFGAGDLGTAAGGVHVALAKLPLTWAAVIPCAWSAAGSRMTRMVRSTPPVRVTAATPGTESSRLAMVLSMYQLSSSRLMSVVWAPT